MNYCWNQVIIKRLAGIFLCLTILAASLSCKREEDSEPLSEIAAPPEIEIAEAVKPSFIQGKAFYGEILQSAAVSMFQQEEGEETLNSSFAPVQANSQGLYQFPVLEATEVSDEGAAPRTLIHTVRATKVLAATELDPVERSITLNVYVDNVNEAATYNVNVFTTLVLEVAAAAIKKENLANKGSNDSDSSSGLTLSQIKASSEIVKNAFPLEGDVHTLDESDQLHGLMVQLIGVIAKNSNLALNTIIKYLALDILDGSFDGKEGKDPIRLGTSRQLLASYSNLIQSVLSKTDFSEEQLANIQILKDEAVAINLAMETNVKELKVEEGSSGLVKLRLLTKPKLYKEIKVSVTKGPIEIKSNASMIFKEDDYDEYQEIEIAGVEENEDLNPDTGEVTISGDGMDPLKIKVEVSDDDIETPEMELFSSAITSSKDVKLTAISCDMFSESNLLLMIRVGKSVLPTQALFSTPCKEKTVKFIRCMSGVREAIL